jgi:two-component system LytT family sensor kinase
VYGVAVAGASAWRQSQVAREETERAARADALRARAELAAMRSQLNPHFVLNTFHALLGLVRRDPALAERGLERLGDLLRATLRVQREGRDEVSLGEEWRMVETYLELERLRLGERLQVTVDLPAALCASPVPTFAVQTLVENAVRHAVAARPEGGRLVVSATRAGGGLRIEVRDDGNGSRADDGEGLGLALLRDRLAALYDGSAHLVLEQGGEGTRAVLDLPAADAE